MRCFTKKCYFAEKFWLNRKKMVVLGLQLWQNLIFLFIFFMHKTFWVLLFLDFIHLWKWMIKFIEYLIHRAENICLFKCRNTNPEIFKQQLDWSDITRRSLVRLPPSYYINPPVVRSGQSSTHRVHCLYILQNKSKL